MSKKYRVRWKETVQFATDVWATSKAEALETFQGTDTPSIERWIPIGGEGVLVEDSIEIEEGGMRSP